MKKRGFTLIELIFVIVIIGVLAAVAVPKFQNLKESAKVNNLIKIVKDMQTSIPSVYMNLVDLEEKDEIININDLVKVSGKGWHYPTSANSSWVWYGEDTSDSTSIARIVLHNQAARRKREVEIDIRCWNFKSKIAQKKCAKYTGVAITQRYREFIKW